jgi:hypothetical protein
MRSGQHFDRLRAGSEPSSAAGRDLANCGPQVLIAAITVMRSVTIESPGTQNAPYGCRWVNPLIAATAEGLEPEARSSGARNRFAACPEPVEGRKVDGEIMCSVRLGVRFRLRTSANRFERSAACRRPSSRNLLK